MNKYIVSLASSILLLPGYVNAYSSFDGFYAGVKTGGIITSANGTSNYNTTLVDSFEEDNFLQGASSWDRNRNSFVGSLFAGYGQSFNCVYVAGEVFANFANRNTSANTTFNSNISDDEDYFISQSLGSQTKVNSNTGEYGVDFKPGLIYCNTLFYLRLGLAYNQVKLTNNSNLTYTDTNSTVDPEVDVVLTQNFSQSRSKNLWGGRFGFGVEHKLTQQLGLTFDYIHTDYGSLSVSGSGPITTPFGTADGYSSSNKVSLKNNAVLVGLSYRFC